MVPIPSVPVEGLNWSLVSKDLLLSFITINIYISIFGEKYCVFRFIRKQNWNDPNIR